MRTFGFIPRMQDDEENDAIEDELHTLREMWDARQLAQALVADQMLKDFDQSLFEQVRTYARQLEALDPDSHSAAEEIGNVALALSCAESPRERLDALTVEAGRLKLALAEIKHQRAKRAKRVANFRLLVACAEGLFEALVWALVPIAVGVALMTEGVLSSQCRCAPSGVDALRRRCFGRSDRWPQFLA